MYELLLEESQIEIKYDYLNSPLDYCYIYELLDLLLVLLMMTDYCIFVHISIRK